MRLSHWLRAERTHPPWLLFPAGKAEGPVLWLEGCVVDSDPQGSSPCSIIYFLVTLCLTFLTYKMGTTRESISQAPPEQYNLCFLTSTASALQGPSTC